MKNSFELIVLILIAAAGIGWVANIIKTFSFWGQGVDGELVIRIIGIPVFFIGAIVGWF